MPREAKYFRRNGSRLGKISGVGREEEKTTKTKNNTVPKSEEYVRPLTLQ